MSEEQAQAVYKIPVGRQYPPGMTGKHTYEINSYGCQNKTSTMWAAVGMPTTEEELQVRKGDLVASRYELLSGMSDQLRTHVHKQH